MTWRIDMKAITEKFAVFAAGFLIIGLGVGHAQIRIQVNFTMSQPFTVANTTLPPGSYTIRSVQGSDQAVLEIASVNGDHSVMVETDSAQPDPGQTGSHLVFHKYKNVLALSEVFPSGGNSGYRLAQGEPEKLASKTEQPTKEIVNVNTK
jgi:hypothetical protein